MFAQTNVTVSSIMIGSHSTNGWVHRAHLFHRKGHLCLSSAFYFTFFAVPLNTPRWTRLRIQVRRSTYVRLGFRRSESPPASPQSLSRLCVLAPFRHFRYTSSEDYAILVNRIFKYCLRSIGIDLPRYISESETGEIRLEE